MTPEAKKRVLLAAIAFAAIANSQCATDAAKQRRVVSRAPKSVEQAVEVLRSDWLSDDDQAWILRNPRDAVMAHLHLPFGTAVRNDFGLWAGNSELMASCGVDHPDHCSGVIFRRLWDSVREDADPSLVHDLDCQFQLLEIIQIVYVGFYKLRIGEILEQVQDQIDEQLEAIDPGTVAGCELELALHPKGEPDLGCWARVEFSQDGRDPVSLGAFLGSISWRNGFGILHYPPRIDLPFHEQCAWPEPPTWFYSGSE